MALARSLAAAYIGEGCFYKENLQIPGHRGEFPGPPPEGGGAPPPHPYVVPRSPRAFPGFRILGTPHRRHLSICAFNF